jgi:PKD repeat protein
MIKFHFLIIVLIVFSLNLKVEAQLLWHNPHHLPKFEASANDQQFMLSRYESSCFIIGVSKFFSTEDIALMAASGIEVHDYLPNNHYLISTKFPIFPALNIPFFEEISEFKASYKLSEALFFGELCSNNQSKYLVQWVKGFEPDIKAYVEYNKNIEQVSYENQILKITLNSAELEKFAKLKWVKYIQCEPVAGEPEDKEGRSLHRVNLIGNNTKENLFYDGTGVKVCVRDDGFVGPHADFTNRITQDVLNDIGNHGDMVSGILCGAGNIDPNIEGMAPNAQLYVINYQADFLDRTLELHQKEGVVITNSSYSDGCNLGYTLVTQVVDNQIFENPNLIHVFSAGNANGSDCGYGAGNQWGNVTGGHKIAKNCLTVANIMVSGVVDPTSSRGPTKDGRMKPEVSARGNNQLSTNQNNTYQVGGGTSAASPSTAGTAALLYQIYKEKNGGANPPSALIKACLMNTATDIGTFGPDYIHGYGIIDAYSSYKLLNEKRYQSFEISNGEDKEIELDLPSSALIKVMLYYTEQSSSPLTSKALINNVDMTMSLPDGSTKLPLVLNPNPNISTLAAGAKEGIELNNNFEQIVLVNPVSGKYKVKIKGSSVPDGKVSCYLLYDIQDQKLKLTSPQGGERYQSPEATVIYFTSLDTINIATAKYSTDAGRTWVDIRTNPSANRVITWTIPAGINSDSCLVEVSQGAFVDRSDYFTIAQLVPNIRVLKFCPDALELTWDQASKDSFMVFSLGQTKMEPFKTVMTNSIQIAPSEFKTRKWFAVAGYRNGILSKRGKAISAPDSLYKCPITLDLGIVLNTQNTNNIALGCDEAVVFPSFKIHNRTVTNANAFSINAELNGKKFTTNYSTLVKPYDTVVVKFNNGITLNNEGINKIKVWLSYTGDENDLNDTTELQFDFIKLKDRTPTGIPYIEEFKQQIPPTWTIVNNTPSTSVNFPTLMNKNMQQDAMFRFFNNNANYIGSSFTMVSDAINLVNSVQPYFYFDHAYNKESASSGDTLIIRIKELCTAGGLEKDIFYFGGDQLTTARVDTNQNWVPNTDSVWYSHEISLEDFIGKNIVIEFNIKRGYFGTLLLDNIEVAERKVNTNIAAMKINPTEPCLNRTIVIQDSSNFNARSISWDFGPGSVPRTFIGKGPVSYRYTGSSGVKQILEKIEAKDKDYFLVSSINVITNPQASYSYSILPNGRVQFVNNSKLAKTFLWEFGDNTSSTEENPIHAFTNVGVYKVRLTSTNQCGTNSASKDINITVVGTEEFEQLAVSIYPNPCIDLLNLNHKQNLNLEYVISNAEGKIVQKGRCNSNCTLDVSKLMTGLYQIELFGENANSTFKKQFEKISK